MKKNIIISAVNFSEGGPLSIMDSLLDELNSSLYAEKYNIYALVHKKNLFKEFNNINLIEFPAVKNSWLNRIIFEYITSKKISKDIKSFLWLSMHDVSPNIVSEKRGVYCHNPLPFYKVSFSSLFNNPKWFIYVKLYKYLYKVNIKKNDFVIVQQNWIKQEFSRMFNISKEKIVVSLPGDASDKSLLRLRASEYSFEKEGGYHSFFYPALPREFKNFEVICEAVKKLNERGLNGRFRIFITIDGTENRYSEKIFKYYSNIDNIVFLGRLTKEEVYKYYDLSDTLIFPSKLETWGLPISEYKVYQKPMLVADLPYAYETVGAYEKVCYFSVNDSTQLADLMEASILNSLSYDSHGETKYEEPVCRSWLELMEVLLNERNN